MKLFECQNCSQTLYFDNTFCESCGFRLGYVPRTCSLIALYSDFGCWRAFDNPEKTYHDCANFNYNACNWLIDEGDDSQFCAACAHNLKIPDLSEQQNLLRWRKLELAKHQLFYSVIRFALPHPTRRDDPEHGLAFEFLTDAIEPGGRRRNVLTGHDNGLITINVKEADDAERERLRAEMGETYRTLLGHFRHETGHYYWDRLTAKGNRLEQFRALFGDERIDYAGSLQQHYARGAPQNWRMNFVSAYASSHPWEDWAETFAHYFHIVDTLETAYAFGLEIHPNLKQPGKLESHVRRDPYGSPNIEELVRVWLPLTVAVNSLNRSMGQPDLYPFVLTDNIVRKLRLVHNVVHANSQIHKTDLQVAL